MDWIVTIPQQVEWETYREEIIAVSDWKSEMMYRVPFKPKALPGDRCYVVWRGKVRGWMSVVNTLHWPEGFVCSTTGKKWPPGYYICRSGPFHAVDGPEMKGFQGIRRFQPSDA